MSTEPLPRTVGDVEGVTLRPADIVMSPRRAQAAYPNALSFARTGMAMLVAGRWRIEKLRVELDARGRGEVLYRFAGQGWTFHFFLVSIELAEEVKLDRNFAQSWDAMGVLCQGEWTPERERLLRREVPKQRAGRADYDTLMYARGNRSGRLFAHVVDSLAEGRQPDLSLIAKVGYILRTTAFIGNGQLGTRPLAGYEPDHPFCAPYHAQIASAFLLREYVFDLVDVMARARNPRSARLCRSYRRHIGLGNSAATGLLAYAATHPRLIDRWQSTWEQAIAEAKARLCGPDAPGAERLLRLLRRAETYFRESAGEADAVFADAATVADDLSVIVGKIEASHGTVGGSFRLACRWAEAEADPETREVLNAIALELCPGIVQAHVHAFEADELVELDPVQRVGDLALSLRREHGWALSHAAVDEAHLWYRARRAPRDVRRGLRRLARGFERETPMDVARKLRELDLAIAAFPPATPLVDLLAARPDLRWIATRVQGNRNRPYAELRDDFLSPALSPFAAIRLVLAFYGMEKFETALPKSVRGALLQGAPIAEDVAAGLEGTWPFPPRPQPSVADETDEAPASRLADPVEPSDRLDDAVPIARPLTRVAPIELVRASVAALQGCGLELGVAEEAARLVELSEGLHGDGLSALLREIEAGRLAASRTVRASRTGEGLRILHAQASSAIVAAPLALDLACCEALRTPLGMGAVQVLCASAASAVRPLAARAAERGLASLLVWSDPRASAGTAGFALATVDDGALVYLSGPRGDLAQAIGRVAPGGLADDDAGLVVHLARATALGGAFEGVDRHGSIPAEADGSLSACEYVLICAQPGRSPARGGPVADMLPALSRMLVGATHLRIDEQRRTWHARGFPVPSARLAALEAAASRAWLSDDEEATLHPNGLDPLCDF